MDGKKMRTKKWINTAAGKVSISLFIFSAIMLMLVCCCSDCLDEVINNILIGLATNLIGIVVTISFVQYFVDKQDIDEERKEEAKKILRYHKIMELLIDRYTLFFQCLTSPIEKRSEIARSKDLQRDFTFSDLSELYNLSLVLSVELLRPTVELFYDAEHELRDFIIEMIKSIDFKYNSRIESILTEFIRQSKERDVSGVIINNQQIIAGSKKQSDEVAQYIKEDEKFGWVDRFTRGELSGHLMTPYVILYLLLKTEGQLLTEYQRLAGELKEGN